MVISLELRYSDETRHALFKDRFLSINGDSNVDCRTGFYI